MPAPIGIEADLRLDLRSDVGTRVEARVQNIVGYIRADFRLRKQQEAPNSEADRHEGVEIVRLGQERAVDLARRNLEERMGTIVEPIDPTRGASLSDRIHATPELMATLSPLVGMLLRTRREAVTV